VTASVDETSTRVSTRSRSAHPGPTSGGRRHGEPEWLPAKAAPALRFVRRRPPLWIEGVVLVWLLWVYDAVGNLAPLRVRAAVGHAAAVLHLERALHVSFEASLNRFASSHHMFGLAVSDYYDNAHFVVTLAVLAWLWIAHPNLYRRWRRALVILNVAGFAVFWLYPMAPPRMLAGFTDTVALTHAIGSWHSGGLSSDANQYAAMPSLHLAWAVWSAAAIWSIIRRWPIRGVALAHPLITLFAVLATANHLLTDSVAGMVTAGLAAVVEPALIPVIEGRSAARSGIDAESAMRSEHARVDSRSAREGP
jgi:hypothetical protein